MQVKLWKNFSKKYNSTKQPDDSLAVVKNATLKSPTSVESPTFILEGNDIDYNYVQALGHYYFVDNIILSANNIMELQCSQDLLATYKNNIGNYTTMVNRAASNYDLWLPDSQMLASDEIVQSTLTDGNLLGDYDVNGSYVVRIVGQNGIKNYVMSMGTIQNAFDTFFRIENFDFTSIELCLQSLFRGIADPGKHVLSVKWFPFNCASGTSEIAYFGFTPTSTGVYVAREHLDTGCTITVPDRYYNDWRDYDSRYVSCSVWLPGLGTVSFDPKYLQKTLQCTYFVDINTGNADIWLLSGGEVIGTYSGTCGVNIQVGGLGGGIGQISALGSMASGIGSLNPVGFATNTLKGAGELITAAHSPTTNMCGTNGNKSVWITQPFIRVNVSVLGTSDRPTASEGLPLRKNVRIGTLSGYVQCANASIDIPSLGNDRDAVNAMLNSGFYYE